MFIRNYQLLISAVSAWALAQILKVIIHMITTGEFVAERLIGNGGMPSSHSATVSALAAACCCKYGPSSAAFAVTAILACIVITDATGVRLETGKQAKLLNEIIEEDIFRLKNLPPQKRFKELVGHTPLQVLVGCILGIAAGIAIEFLCRAGM